MMMKLFDNSSEVEQSANDQSTCLFKFESESKLNGFYVGFRSINTDATSMTFITYSETGEEITHSSTVARMSQEILNNIANAAGNGYDFFIKYLKSFNTCDDRVRDFIKWGVRDVEKAFMKQNSSQSLGLS